VLTSSLKIPQQRAQNVKLGTLATVVEYVFLLPGKTTARVRRLHPQGFLYKPFTSLRVSSINPSPPSGFPL
jgi:hypothetical protein